jgi:hypothetical protein
MNIFTSKFCIVTVKFLPVKFLCMGMLFVSVFLTNTAFAKAGEKSDVPGKNINITHINMMFDNIKKNTNWDTSADLRWSYYFSHSDPSQLEKAQAKLVAKGYRFVDLNISEDDDEFAPIGSYYLQVDKIETHSPSSLDKRNDEFFSFANDLGLDSYGGMDAGPVVNTGY